MKLAHPTAAFALVLACAACGPDGPAPTDAGIAPDASVAVAPPPRTDVELSEPIAPPTPIDVAPTAETPPPATIAFEIAPHGRFEVVTWGEAARRAAGIEAERAAAELRRLRQELLARRR